MERCWRTGLGTLILLAALLAKLQQARAGLPGSHRAASVVFAQHASKFKAARDEFLHFDEKQKRAFAYDDGRTLNQTYQSLFNARLQVQVDVRLVGFAGDGLGGVRLDQYELVRYLKALHLDIGSVVLQPTLRHLIIQPEIQFRAYHASPQLVRSAASAVRTAVDLQRTRASGSSPLSMVYVPHDTVDNVIRQDWQVINDATSGPGRFQAPSFTLYILNLPHDPDLSYLYTYDDGEATESSKRSCPGQLYVSKEPYAWIDLAAGPPDYGPLASDDLFTAPLPAGSTFATVAGTTSSSLEQAASAAGSGISAASASSGPVFTHSVPSVKRYTPPEAAASGLLPELAALAGSAVQHLAWPPVMHMTGEDIKGHSGASGGADSAAQVDIHIIHIHDTLGVPPRSVDAQALEKVLNGALTGLSVVNVKESHVSMATCDVCVAAYTGAQRMRTSRDYFRGAAAVTARRHLLLDRLWLHRHLAEYGDSVWAFAGVQWLSYRRQLPVYVFDLSDKEEDGILLDGVSQAAAFPDMVIAVASKSGNIKTGHTCYGRHVEVAAGSLTRPLLAAILQTGWAVADTTLYYHPATGLNVRHLWALADTPFGPLSARLAVSWAQAGAAARNTALLELDMHLRRAAQFVQALTQLSRDGRSIVGTLTGLAAKATGGRVHASQHAGYVSHQRLNLILMKKDLALRYLGHGRTSDALRLAQSMAYDVEALDAVARNMAESMTTTLECVGHLRLRQLLWPPAASLALLLMAVWWRARANGSGKRREDARYDRIY